MPSSKINPTEMYGLTRCKSQDDKYLGWQVIIYRRGMRFCKSFHDLKWEGSENALAAAKRYRDALVQLVPPLTIREFSQTVKTNNTSGLVGVHPRQMRSGVVWVARIQLPGGKGIYKSFSEIVYGPRARELAIEARQDLLNLVDKTSTHTFSPGAIAQASPNDFPDTPLHPPRALTVRVAPPGINAKNTDKDVRVRVSDATSPPVRKTFSTVAHGQAGAFRLAMQAALTAVAQLGGAEEAKIFMRDYVEKYKRLPKKGISARIRFVGVLMPVENAAKRK